MVQQVAKEFPRNELLDEMRGQPSRMLGFGATPKAETIAGRSVSPQQQMIGMIRKCMDTPSYALPTIESVTNYFSGPVSNANLTNSFGSTINLLQPTALAGAETQSSTFAEVGKFQTYVLILALQWRMDIEPLNYTIKGNSAPQNTQAGSKIISPDAFTVTTGAAANTDGTVGGPLGTFSAANLIKPATLEWGWWQDLAAYFMARAYNLQWKYGNNFLFMNENLQYTMHVPSNAQEGTGSSSEIDPLYMAREANAQYFAAGFPSQFALINYSRYGNQTLAAAGQSVFHPTRAYDTVGVTYGGAGSRSVLRCNSEWKRLSCPILCGPGVPIGLTAIQQVQDFVNAMQAWLDPNFGLGTNDFTESNFFTAGVTGGNYTSGTTGVEISFDNAPALNSLTVFADRVVFKGGRWSITLGFKGVEMSPDQAALYKDTTTRQMISSATGLAISPKQNWHA